MDLSPLITLATVVFSMPKACCDLNKGLEHGPRLLSGWILCWNDPCTLSVRKNIVFAAWNQFNKNMFKIVINTPRKKIAVWGILHYKDAACHFHWKSNIALSINSTLVLMFYCCTHGTCIY